MWRCPAQRLGHKCWITFSSSWEMSTHFKFLPFSKSLHRYFKSIHVALKKTRKNKLEKNLTSICFLLIRPYGKAIIPGSLLRVINVLWKSQCIDIPLEFFFLIIGNTALQLWRSSKLGIWSQSQQPSSGPSGKSSMTAGFLPSPKSPHGREGESIRGGKILLGKKIGLLKNFSYVYENKYWVICLEKP